MKQHIFIQATILMLPYIMISTGITIFVARKMSKDGGKPFWLILYYGSVFWQMDPRHKNIHANPVYTKNLLTEVNVIQGLHIKFGQFGMFLFILLLVGLSYFEGY